MRMTPWRDLLRRLRRNLEETDLAGEGEEGQDTDDHGQVVPVDPPAPPPAPPPPPAGYAQTVGEMCGYGVVNQWFRIDAAELGDALLAAGLTMTHIEFLGWGERAPYDDPSRQYEPALVFVREMRRRGILTFVNLVNANIGSGKYGDQAKPMSAYGDGWFAEMVRFWSEEVGPEGVILQAVSEWSEAPGAEWCRVARERWPGDMSWNKESRPRSAPAGYRVFEYHAGDVGDIGPGGALVTTDHSRILTQLGGLYAYADTGMLRGYAERVRAAGRGFVYYGFGHRGIDRNAIRVLGEV